MFRIAGDISTARQRTSDDTLILKTLLEKQPDLKENIRIAIQERGATPSQVLDQISNKYKQQEVPQEIPQEPGFIQGVAQGIASPFLRTGVTLYGLGAGAKNVAEAGISKLTGNKEAYQRNIDEGLNAIQQAQEGGDFGYFGKAKSLGQNAGNIQRPLGEQFKSGAKDLKDAVGLGAELGSNFIGGSGAASVGKGILKQSGKAALKGLGAGAATGGLTSLGSSLQRDESLGQTAKNTAIGTALGGAFGGAIGGAGSLASGAVRGTKSLFSPTVTKRAIELTKLDNSYVALRKQSAKAAEKGIDVKKMLAETDLLQNSVDKEGTIRTQNAIVQLNDFMKPQEDVISQTLRKEGRKIPLGMVESKLKTTINDSGLQGGAKLRALKNVADDIEGYRLGVDKDGYIPVSLIHDAKVDKYANINYLNPESKRSDKAIAKALKELVEEHTKSVDVKQLNQELSQYYTLQAYLEALDGKKVAGGKLGKYFAQTVGAIAGSHFGPLGAIAGAEAGGMIKGASMASKFGGAGKKLQQSAAMKSAVEKGKNSVIHLPQSKSLGSLKTTQSTTMTPMINGIKNTITDANSIPKGNLYSFAGAGAGFEKDDDGKIKFNPEKAAIGLGLVAGVKLTPQQTAIRETITRLGQQLTRRPTRANKIAYENAIKLFHKLSKK